MSPIKYGMFILAILPLLMFILEVSSLEADVQNIYIVSINIEYSLPHMGIDK